MTAVRNVTRDANLTKGKRLGLDYAVANLQQRFGSRVFLQAPDVQARPRSIPTGFAGLDEISGIGGIPLNAITLLTGHTTSGKLTLAYKVLSQAQQSNKSQADPVAIIDLTATTDADYLTRCGVNLDYLLLARPQSAQETVEALLDMLNHRHLRAILLDALPVIAKGREFQRYFESNLAQLTALVKNSNCALICLDNSYHPTRQESQAGLSSNIGARAALHIGLERERWLIDSDELHGYQSRVRIVRSRWGSAGRSTMITFDFNETVKARETW